MKEITHKNEFMVQIPYQELRDMQSIFNNILIMNHDKKDSDKYKMAEKYYYEIDKIINKQYDNKI